MTPVFDPRIAGWVAERLPDCERGFGECSAMGVFLDDRLVAGVVFHNWHPEAGVVEVSSAADDARWLSRSILRAAMSYVFVELDCQLLAARTALENMRVRKLWRGLGASEYVIPRLRGRNQAEVIMTLPQEVWAASKFAR